MADEQRPAWLVATASEAGPDELGVWRPGAGPAAGHIRLRFAGLEEAAAHALGLRRLVGAGEAGFRAGLSADADSPEQSAERLCEAASPGQVLADRAPSRSRYGYRPEPGPEEPRRWELSWWPGEQPDHGIPFPGRARLACGYPPAFIGRAAEISTIEDAWLEVASGSSITALVAGEPGIGKTRLVAEAAREVDRAGGAVLWGRCREDLEVPLQPFAEALGAFSSGGSDGPGKEHLAEPVRELLFGSPTDDPVAPTRRLLFDAAAGTLEALSRVAPTMLVLEDAHAIDVATLDLLRFLAGSQRHLRLLILITHRPLDARARKEVCAALAELRREPGARQLSLAPLGESEVIALASGVLGSRAVERGLAGWEDELAATVAGNPLFAIECARGLASGHARAAQGALASERVGEALSARLAAGDEASRRMLEAAAVCGREFEPELVGEIAGASASELTAALTAAERAGIVARAPESNRYQFAHSLIWRWLVEQQSGARRGERHRLIAEALERRTPEDAKPSTERSAELAWHWSRAAPANHERTIAWTGQAARRALAAFDAHRAERLYTQALELSESSGEGATHRLMIGRGTALRRLGRPDGRRMILEAARLAREAGDADALAYAALVTQSGTPSTLGAVDEERVAILRLAERELARRGGPGDGATRARLLSSVGLELTFSGDEAERLRVSADALRLARESGDRAAIAAAALDGMHSRWVPESLVERSGLAEEAVAIASEVGDPYLLIRSHHMRAVTRVQEGKLALARADLEAERALARRLGDSTTEWAAAVTATGIAIVAGDVELAEREAERALADSEGTRADAVVYHAAQTMVIRFLQGRLGEQAQALELAAAEMPGIPGLRAPLALALLSAGRIGDAARLLEAEAEGGFAALPRDTTWLFAHTIWAHVAAELGSLAAAEVLLPRLEPFEAEISYTAVSALGLVGHAVARLELTLGRVSEGIERLRAASARYREIGAGAWQALAEAQLAAALRARGSVGDLTEASARARSAIGLAASAGASGVLEAAQAALGAGDAPWVGAEVAERARSAGLTPRELEVLIEASGGGTNSEVGASLGITGGTVKRHLERIYDKLGVRTRTGAVSRIVVGHADSDG